MRKRRRLAGRWVATDDEGFLVDGLDWTPEIAEALAREAGVDGLRAAHWTVLSTCREAVARTGQMPSLARLAALAAVPLADLDRLFAGQPAALIARLAGLPNPSLETDPQSTVNGSPTGGVKGVHS